MPNKVHNITERNLERRRKWRAAIATANISNMLISAEEAGVGTAGVPVGPTTKGRKNGSEHVIRGAVAPKIGTKGIICTAYVPIGGVGIDTEAS